MGGPQIFENPLKRVSSPVMPSAHSLARSASVPMASVAPDQFSLRFRGKGPLPETMSAFGDQVGQSVKRYYWGAATRKFFHSMVLMTPKPENEAYHLEERLWKDIFSKWTEQPEQARQQLQTWEKAGNLAVTQPVMSFFLRHIGEILSQPHKLQREVSLVTLGVMVAGVPKTQEFSALLRSPAFKQAPVETQMSLIIPALQPFVEPLLKQPMALELTLRSYLETMKRLPASASRDAGVVGLKHLNSLIYKPEELKQELGWWQSQLNAGGWQKLSQLRELVDTPGRFTPPEQTARLLDGWDKVTEAVLANPDTARANLTSMRQTVARTLPEGQSRTVVLTMADRLLEGIQQPETLKQELLFLRALIANMGISALKETVTPFLDRTFEQAPPEQKRQLLGTALNSLYQALVQNPDNSKKLLQRVQELVPRQLPAGFKQTAALTALDYLGNTLTEPEAGRAAIPLVQQFFSQHSLPSLEALFKPFTEPGFATLPKAEKQQQFETAINTVLGTLTANPKETTAFLDQVQAGLDNRLPAGFKRGILTFALTHLKESLGQPERLQQEIKLISQILGNGGLEKLQTVLPLMRSPAFAKADVKQQGQWLIEGLGDIFKPLLEQPEAPKAVLGYWLETIEKAYPQGLARDTIILLGTHLQKNLDQPEKLTRALQLVSDIMDNGGYKKLAKLEKVIQSEVFKTATPMKQGQYLLEGLGPIFVKAFQTLSTIPDLFKPHIQASMKQLYEDITPIPFEEIQSVIETEFGKPIDQAFEKFDRTPLKAGSIAQVHQAVVNGRDVAVKIVKPDVELLMDEDINLLKPFVLLGQQMAPHLDANAFYEAFRVLIKNEANMSKMGPNEPDGEAQHLVKIRDIFKEMPNVVVPEVFKSHTTKHVLTMEFMKGKSLHNTTNNPEVAKDYLGMLLDQIFYYGACQADPHPGNVLYNPETKKFACIDAGLMYFSTPEERLAFAKILVALYTQNVDQIAHAIVPPGMAQRPQFAPFLGKLKGMPMLQQKNMDYKSTLLYLNTISQVAKEYSLDVVTVNPLLWKTLFTAVAVAKTLDSNVSIAYPAIAKLAGLFISEREAGFMTSAAWTLLRDQGGKLLDQSGKWWEQRGQLWDYVSGQFGGRKPKP